MSSESEDDFLSADEGSEDEEPISKPSSPALQGEHPISPQERGATDGQDIEGMEDINTDDDEALEPATESEMHKISEASNIKESHTLDEDLPTQNEVENISTVECQNLSKECLTPSGEDHTATIHDDPQDNLLHKSKEEMDSQLEERKRVAADSRNDSSPTEICRSALQELKVSGECDLGHPKEVKKESLSGKEDDNKKEDLNVKEIQTDPGSGKTRVVGARLESETVNLADKTKGTKQEKKLSSRADEDASSTTTSKKPRESKIGRKKPREKLGERLGAKKLGSRVVKKPLESISSDDVMTPKPGESDSVMRDGTWGHQNSQGGRCVKEESKLEAEKSQERESEEKRWQQAQQPHQHHVDEAEGSVGWGDAWGGWGSSLLSAASTFTREVGRGVGTVMETVESGLGVPSAETMAQEVAEHTKKEEEQQKHTLPDVDETSSSGESDGESGDRETGESGQGGMWLGSLVSGVSGALETASNKVLLGGLDTLEVLGRKAMDVIQDGDPGLRKKRAILTNVKPNLSQVLQDARLRAAEEEREGSMCEGREASHITFATVWDRTEGVVHLEALSLVARQCEAKITSLTQSLPHYFLESVHTANAKIKSTCEMAEEESLEWDLAQHVVAIITNTDLPLSTTKICDAWSRVQKVSSEKDGVGETELYESLAEVVAQLVALIHKAAELALITPESEPDKLATQFKELSSGVWGSLEETADLVCGNITTQAPATDSNVNNTITNIYLQVSHGSSYIQQSMAHLSSVLQHVNTKQVAAQL